MTEVMQGQPFDLDADPAGYRRWRDWKLRSRPADVAALKVRIADPRRPTAAERAAVIDRCRRANMAIYVLERPADKADIRALGAAFGLRRLDVNLCADGDGITSLAVCEPAHRVRAGYIPYTDRALNWHTDGYYNPPERRVRAILMHCVRQAPSGGANRLLDPELVYLLMRDESPALVRALMAPDAMTIPPNREADGRELRGATRGPVFWVDPDDGALRMRYSARGRNVVWKQDAATRAALAFLQKLWVDPHPWAYHYRLQPGEGVICNNVLHTREAFRDGETPTTRRLLYRARYLEPVVGTAPGIHAHTGRPGAAGGGNR